MNITLEIILLAFLLSAAYAGLRAAPFFPTKKNDVARAVKLARIAPGQKFYDLGSGDGRIICAMADKGAKATGFEISLLPYLLAQFRTCFSKNKPEIKFNDFWNQNLSDADVVYFFLMKKIYPKLKQKLEKELQPGTKVIAYCWPIIGWEPVLTDRQPGNLPIYLYTIK